MKPRYVLVKWNGCSNVASLIETKKQLEAWLEDGSLQEGDVIYELKEKLKVITFEDKGLVLEKVECIRGYGPSP